MAKRNRTIRGLKWVKLLDGAPIWLPKQKVTGVMRKGLVYENRVGDYLKAWLGDDRVLHGPWLEFEDRHGKSWCQPDYVILSTEDDPMVIVEVKLTHKRGAKSKLKNLYAPACKKIWKPVRGKPPKMVQICKNLDKKFNEETIERRDLFVKDFSYAVWNMRKTL